MDVCVVFRVVREKKRGKNKPTARYLIDQYAERGKAIIKKKKQKNKGEGSTLTKCVKSKFRNI
jgi:hypothetical protein